MKADVRRAVQVPRDTDWTAEKREQFLTGLATSCNVTLALRPTEMSRAGLYKLRKRDAAFRAAWDEALAEAYVTLELELLTRAIDGTVKTSIAKDGSITQVHDYPNAIALSLLRMHKDSEREARTEIADGDLRAMRQRLFRKIKAVRKRAAEPETADRAR